ncbi:hypothetical protein ANCDUO_06414 [Ancylostoma duodenale]|uniref:Uncharacterized protein n=1 Tax=Ancylostoma duodenale TaxID=51022 RepID=A0A0C2DL07_9BILA|nr:hypothetical protein ANCDUO_06414 [Ancylostoma duodenale]
MFNTVLLAILLLKTKRSLSTATVLFVFNIMFSNLLFFCSFLFFMRDLFDDHPYGNVNEDYMEKSPELVVAETLQTHLFASDEFRNGLLQSNRGEAFDGKKIEIRRREKKIKVRIQWAVYSTIRVRFFAMNMMGDKRRRASYAAETHAGRTQLRYSRRLREENLLYPAPRFVLPERSPKNFLGRKQ